MNGCVKRQNKTDFLGSRMGSRPSLSSAVALSMKNIAIRFGKSVIGRAALQSVIR